MLEPNLALDLTAVRSVEPAGLALLIGCRRLAHASGGDLRLNAVSPAVDRALRRTGVNRVLTLQSRPPPRDGERVDRRATH